MGNAYSFLLTDALAKQKSAQVLLRIDDIDHIRKEDAFLQDIFDTLEFLEISWQIGSHSFQETTRFSQQQRANHYQTILTELRTKNLVYACDCSRADIFKRRQSGDYDGYCRHRHLSLDDPSVAWRLALPETLTVEMRDETGSALPYFLPSDMRDFILKRRDQIPSYQLASFCDDLYFDIDFIIRGADLFHSTIAQLALAQLLNRPSFLQTRFLHHEILKNEHGLKLSKSAGDRSLVQWRRQGMKRDDIIAHIAHQLSFESGNEFLNLLQSCK
jgi:glutamyl-tRNA synthetase